MQLSRASFISFISFISLFTGVVNAAWQESSYSPPSCHTSNSVGCYLPINSSLIDQTKDGSLVIGQDLFSSWMFAVNGLGVGPGFADTPPLSIDPNAVLDVDGQIRIRGGTPLPFGYKYVLSSDVVGLASWKVAPSLVGELLAPYEIIILNDTPVPPDRTIQIDPTKVQRTITNGCAPNQAMNEVQESGAVECKAFVTTINTPAGSGLLGGGVGARSLTLNLQTGGGLSVVGGQLSVDSPSSGSGLKFFNNQLQFDDYQCGPPGAGNSGEYWRISSTGSWSCGPLSPPVPTPPGGSMMQLKVRSTSGAPPACPNSATTGQWADLGVTTEYAATTSAARHNVRTCWRNLGASPSNDRVCQVMYFKQAQAISPFGPPNCPSGWEVVAPVQLEYTPGDANFLNAVRTCFRCN